MKIHNALLGGLFTLCSLNACKPGFNLTEQTTLDEEDADTILLGATSDGTWKILIKESNTSFTLQKLAQPDSSTAAESLNGTYATESSGWVKYTISSTLPSKISNADFYAIELANAATIVFPFYDNNNQWLPLVNVGDCPSNDVSGNAILLERPSDATRSDRSWLGNYSYDVGSDDAELIMGYALDNDFTEQSSLTQDSGNCDNGYVKRSGGNHYIGSRATLIELEDDVITDGNTRLLSLPSRVINALSDTDDQTYIGMLREFSSPEDNYRVTAKCTAGVCELYEGEDESDQVTTNLRYTLTLNDSNRNYDSKNGLITGSLVDRVTTTSATTNVLCMINTDIDTSSSDNKVIACTAQAPNDTTKIVQFILSAS